MRGLLIAPTHAPTTTTGTPDAPKASAWFDPDAAYVLDPHVSLRPEPFGALAYHYETRRLTFLRSPLLVDVVRALPDHTSVRATVEALVAIERRSSFLRAIASLAESSFIVPASHLPNAENQHA